ncbi:HTH-type transcriptional activator Btr [mine drainage metagenome]|uniref:HTH-type transcriptional activator Btr n=1 Tax=mine drainage metagenome TaxID=410659 RepID=A0A1J5RDH8_9ZZZZ
MPSINMRYTAQGEYLLDFPKECPARLILYDFSGRKSITPSYHDYCELIYIHEGRGSFLISDLTYEVNEGDLILVGSGEFHLLSNVKFGRLRVASLHFQPTLLHATGGPEIDLEYLRPFMYRGPGYKHHVSARSLPPGLALRSMSELWRWFQVGGPLYPLGVRTRLLDLLLEVRLLYRDPKQIQKPLGPVTTGIRRLEPLFRWIRANPGQSLSLAHAGRLAHMSPGHFCRSFKKTTGYTLTEYLLRRRVDMACDMLLRSSKSVTEIALDTGFSSHSYFTRIFRRTRGETPNEFRKRHNGAIAD